MTKVSVVTSPPQPSGLHQLVDDYLMACRARELAPGTITTSYGYPLRSIFLPWCDEHSITRPDQLDARAVDAFSVDLLARGGKGGRPLSKYSVHAYARAIRGFLTWCACQPSSISLAEGLVVQVFPWPVVHGIPWSPVRMRVHPLGSLYV
jgi:hypothetical protein